MLMVLLIEFVWLVTVRSHDLSERDKALQRGDICVDETLAEDPWSILLFSKAKYKKAVRWDFGEFGHGCKCPGSFGMLTADPEACK